MAVLEITEVTEIEVLLVLELGVAEWVAVIVQEQGRHWYWSRRWNVLYSKASWEQGVDAPAQVALKREEADYQTEISVVQGPVGRQGQPLCEGGHPEW